MTQTLYAHMNKRNKKKKERLVSERDIGEETKVLYYMTILMEG
jgi:hypothetical protein